MHEFIVAAVTTPLFDLGSALTGMVDQITAQVGAALPVVLPVGGGLIAVGLAWKFGKRFVKG
jgi:hypothetical protein